jgi:hypothetical protein
MNQDNITWTEKICNQLNLMIDMVRYITSLTTKTGAAE